MAPAAAPSPDPRPVLVRIHGGRFLVGHGGEPEFDGAALASKKGLVVVTLNYRMGVFGYLALLELGAESGHGTSMSLTTETADEILAACAVRARAIDKATAIAVVDVNGFGGATDRRVEESVLPAAQPVRQVLSATWASVRSALRNLRGTDRRGGLGVGGVAAAGVVHPLRCPSPGR
ncbi:carboxylesterase family protein [Streptomyces prunicolor]|uniref:carboxylesterase family protein n=1 Tax=Streptomyces prunicolor TaxID=67348 RepID=UPI0038683F41